MDIIKQNNILIAKFLGWELSKRGRRFKNYIPPFGYVKAHPDHLKFHLSWDWLMLVVYKINRVCHDDDSYFISEKISDLFFGSDEYSSVLDTIPLANLEDGIKVVVEFINYYNENVKYAEDENL